MISAHEYTATIGGTVLPVVGGRIALDDSQAPHVQGSITIPVPSVWSQEFAPDIFAKDFGEEDFGDGSFGGLNVFASRAIDLHTINALDPRLNTRVQVSAVSTNGATTNTRTFDLALRARDITHGDGTLTLPLSSDEALLSDWAPMADDETPYKRRGSMRAICNYVLGRVLPTSSSWVNLRGKWFDWRGQSWKSLRAPGRATVSNPDTDFSFNDANSDRDAFTWKAGQSAMEFLLPLTQSAGLRLVCDENRVWTLRRSDYQAPGTLTISTGLNAIAAAEKIDRDSGDWFDAAVTRYVWKDRYGTEQDRTDAHSLRDPYTRVKLFEKTTPYPGDGFSAYAVRRAQAKGKEGSATTVSDWTAQAEMPVTINLDGSPTQTGRTARVEFDLDRDEMTVTARTTTTPATAWLFTFSEKWTDRRGRPWKA